MGSPIERKYRKVGGRAARAAGGYLKEKAVKHIGRRHPGSAPYRRPISPEIQAGLPGARSAPVRAVNKQVIGKMSTRQQQDYLKRMGYEVMVDGRKGPNTITALDAFRKGKSPGQFNKWWNRQVAIRDDHHDDTPVTPTGQRDVPTRPTPKGTKKRAVQAPAVRSGKGKGKGRVVIPAGRASNNPMLKGGVVDPELLSNALADAEYGPVLAELMRQEERTRNIGTNRAAEIRDMYGTYVKDTEGRFAQANAERERLSAATQGLTAAISGAVPLGEAGAAELAARGGIESEYARSVEQGESEYDRRLVQAAQGGGVFAADQARREMEDQLRELSGQRTEVTTARGAKKAATRQQLIQWNAEHALQRAQLTAQMSSDQQKNRIAAMEAMAAMEMFPLQSEEARAKIEAMYADINRQNMLLPWQIAGAKAGVASTKALTKARLRPPRKTGKAAEPVRKQFTQLSPNEKFELRNRGLEELSGETSMTRAVERTNAYLRAIGYKPRANKRAGAFAKSIVDAWAGAAGVPYKSKKAWWNL